MPFAFLLKGLGLKWYEWLLVGAVLLMAVSLYVQKHRLKAAQADLQLTENKLNLVAGDRDRLLLGRTIDDWITTTTLHDIDAVRTEHDTQQQEFFYEYSKLVTDAEETPPVVAEPEDVVELPPVVITDVIDESAPQPSSLQAAVKPAKPSQDVVSANERARVRLIAKRLYDAYCGPAGLSDCSAQPSHRAL